MEEDTLLSKLDTGMYREIAPGVYARKWGKVSADLMFTSCGLERRGS